MGKLRGQALRGKGAKLASEIGCQKGEPDKLQVRSLTSEFAFAQASLPETICFNAAYSGIDCPKRGLAVLQMKAKLPVVVKMENSKSVGGVVKLLTTLL